MSALRRFRALLALPFALVLAAASTPAIAADHNDPNAANSIFSDIPMSAADLYDMFGWPADDVSRGERVILALTFAPVPIAGTFDPDLLYRVRVFTAPRASAQVAEDGGLQGLLDYFKAVQDRYLHARPGEVRVVPAGEKKVAITFRGFPGGDLAQTIDMNTSLELKAPDGQVLQAYIGGRDDAFFNDLPGFFRSINYAPQFYHVPHNKPELRELPIPKTLIELEGNTLFNFDPANPRHGSGVKTDLPPGPYTWSGNRYLKDANGNFRFVYSGRDAQAGFNVNAIILELPLSYLTRSPTTDRIVNAWGESWVRKASGKVPAIADDRVLPGPVWERYPYQSAAVVLVAGLLLVVATRAPRRSLIPKLAHALGFVLVLTAVGFTVLVASGRGFAGSRSQTLGDEQLAGYKLVDTDGQAFADAALNERKDERQVGADNLFLGPSFIKRLAHLGWGFGPSIRALGLQSAFNDDNAPVSVHKVVDSPVEAFPRVKKMLFQKLNMPDNSWNKRNLPIPLRRTFEVFVPNVNSIDMDTNGTWPFGRRPEDQVATRFLALFLDMTAQVNGKPYDVELLNQPALWQGAAIEPKTPPNPAANDKPFLATFPYLAEPW
ncbi:DUF4331 domain-containing protein [Tahibacter amnicola]|uniref:DUF4331 domain-containing protein n=1 Tax=Tahibacter amnicola TaxID=2976241 RepID=A0ABY6BHC2_9GAMM|nr:DUF4331 domain-containing protein [Tahibacter amnicola]UXI68986.1 DUF4331 domain-containing protein [Tahibacter amnicola]